jgi:hypothetical protein
MDYKSKVMEISTRSNENKSIEINIDLGGYRWPPTYSNWLKTFFCKFTIFSSSSDPKLLGPF